MIKRTILAVAVTASLSACGGGGGGGPGTNPLVRPDVPYYAPVNVNLFRPNVENRYHVAEVGIFARDLNRDGNDEVMTSAVSFNGSATQATWNNSTMQIYGWNTGNFSNETTTWFQGISNQYVGGTTIRFGDFNGDGHTDAFAAAFTDNPNVVGSSVMLLNTGQNRFTRTDINPGNVGAHDSVVADFNGDGFADVWLTDIHEMRPVLLLGSVNGQMTAYRSDVFAGPSGVSVADYLGDGTKTLIMTDATTTGQSDTKLYSWQTLNGRLVITEQAVLPADRFYLPKWDSVRAQAGIAPHAVRTLAMDFDNDGRIDTVVFSTLPKNANAHGYAEVQFLRNTGGGVFLDVTDTVLTKFDHNKTTSYNPQLVDANNDGLVDILITATDYTGQPSNSVLLATQEGKFVESFVNVFSDLSNQVRSMTTGQAGSAGEIAIIAGPNNKRYLFTTVETEINGVSQIKTWLSLVGSTGTITPQATAAAVQQAWPWMSPAEVNAALTTTVSQWIDGVPVLDPWAALGPVGGLGISLDGRTGTRHAIAGSIRVPGLDPKMFKNVVAVDALARDFSVDMSGMSMAPRHISVALTDIDAPEQSWASRLAGNNLDMQKGFDAQGDEQRWAAAGLFKPWGQEDPVSLTISATRMPTNPWLDFDGVFGRVIGSTTIDTSMIRSWSGGYWSQFGLMQTSTDIQPGMIKKVTPLWSAYATAGWRDQHWSVYGGIQPTLLAGSVELSLPSSVDSQGVLHYTDYTVKVRNPAVAFVGGEHRWQTKTSNFRVTAGANQQGEYRLGANYSVRF